MSDRGRPKRPLILTAREQDTLQRWARRRTIGAVALRSRIVLASADGTVNNVGAEELGVTPRPSARGRRASSGTDSTAWLISPGQARLGR